MHGAARGGRRLRRRDGGSGRQGWSEGGRDGGRTKAKIGGRRVEPVEARLGTTNRMAWPCSFGRWGGGSSWQERSAGAVGGRQRQKKDEVSLHHRLESKMWTLNKITLK